MDTHCLADLGEHEHHLTAPGATRDAAEAAGVNAKFSNSRHGPAMAQVPLTEVISRAEQLDQRAGE